jgi:hypothetical protein
MRNIIKRILNEENSLQSKLMQMMKTKGVDMASEVVGGFNNLNKILKLDLDDINVREMLVKNFINFVEIPEIEVTGLEIKNSSSGNRIINILFKTESNASNIESWLVRDIIEYLSGFFPFPVKAVWEPSFGGNNKISLSSELVKEDEDGNINESVLSENKSKENAVKKILKEETDHLRMMLRRLPSKTVRKMDEEFDSSLNYISKMFIKTYKSDPRKLSEHEFTRMVIIDLMSLLDVRNHLPNDVEWYDDVLNGLSKHYKERISSMYNVLKK